MAPKRKLLLKIAVAVVLIACVAGVIVLRSTRFQIAYHDWQMRRAWDDTWSSESDQVTDGMTGYVLNDSWERFEYHRQRLIHLGGVHQLNFRMQHIIHQTRASGHFNNLLLKNSPEAIYWESPSPGKPIPVELTVWCYPQNTESWRLFIAARNVPDYESKFMDANKDTPAAE